MPETNATETPIRDAFTIGRDTQGRVAITVHTPAGPQTLIGGYREARDALTKVLCSLIPDAADLDAMRARAWETLTEAARKTFDPQMAADYELTVDAVVDGITAFTYRCNEYENGWFPTDITVDCPVFGADMSLDEAGCVRDDASFTDEADDPDLYGDLLDITRESVFTRDWWLTIERPAT
ncbi:MAG: hypothetical protein L0H59_19260 [Tomitella sp.]|nr:hypothetical protein [Tomitella sp.]